MMMQPEKEIREREEYIEKKRESLTKRVYTLQRSLFNQFVNKTLSELEIENGNIRSTRSNLIIASLVDRMYEAFNQKSHIPLVESFKRNLIRIGFLNFNYFKKFNRKKAAEVKPSIEGIIRRNLGLDKDNQIVKDGFLHKFVNDQALRNEIKNRTFQAVVSNQPFGNFRQTMSDVIVGNANYNGPLQQHYRAFAYDTYSQIDRQNQILYATRLSMSAFIYGGDVVTDSRPFCRGGRDRAAGRTFKRKTGEVFTLEEARDWANIRKFQGKNRNYNPLTDLGGHNCRHSLNYIDNETAIQLRPDLFIENNELKSGEFRGRTY